MKKLLLLFIPLVLFFSCETEDDNSNTSYNCTNDECYSADGGSGQYATLDDCLSICGDDNNNGDGGYSTTEFCLEIDISCDINARYLYSENGMLNYPSQDFYLTGDNTSATIEPHCEQNYGSTFSYALEFVDMDEVGGCADIEVRVFKEGVLFVTDNFTLGCIEIDFTSTGNNNTYCNTYCGTYGNGFEQVLTY